MIDAFVLLTPLFLLGLIALLGFVGCTSFTASDTTSTGLPTTTTLSSSPNPSTAGVSVALTAQVKDSNGAVVTAGNVAFNGGTVASPFGVGPSLGAPVTIDPTGKAPTTLSVTTLSVGANFISASYQPTAAYAPSTSSLLTQIVLPAAGTAPTVTSIVPNSGPSAGGTSVTITGTSFAAGATVSLGGVAATSVKVFSNTSITATTGPHPSAQVDVVVTNPDAQSGTLPNGFTYASSGLVVTHVQTQANFQSAGGASISLAFSATKGNLLLVTVAWQYSAAPTTIAVSDGTNVYQSAVQSGWGTNRIAQTFFAFNNAASGILSIVATPSAAATELRLVVSEYANASSAPPNPLDGTGKQAGGPGSAIGPAAFTTTAADDLIYAVAAATGAGGVVSASAGFTSRTPAGQTNVLVEEQQAAGTAQSPAGTDSVVAGVWVILALAIKHA